MAEILTPDTRRFPLDGKSFIHKQEGWPDMIAIGEEEIAKLPKKQQKAISKLSAAAGEKSLVAYLASKGGDVWFTDGGTPMLAKVSKKGEQKKFVDWL